MRAVNLIPAEQRGGQPVGAGRSQGAAYAVLAVVAGLAVMAFLYGRADHQISSSRAQVATLTAQAQQAQVAAEQLAPYTNFIGLREARAQAVETLIDSRFDWAHVLHEFGRVLPPGVAISSLTGTIASGASASGTSASSTTSTASTSTSSAAAPAASPAVATTSVTSATPPGSIPAFTLSGCATSQPEVALTLQRIRLIDGVHEVLLQSSTAGSGGGAAGSGCSGHDPSFTAQITFEALPSASAVAAAAKTVSDTAGTGSTKPASANTGVSAR